MDEEKLAIEKEVIDWLMAKGLNFTQAGKILTYLDSGLSLAQALVEWLESELKPTAT